jgi:hypothetical protein
MNVFKVTFHWVDATGEGHELMFVTQQSKVMAEMRAALSNEVQPTFYETCSIHIERVGNYRDTGAT